jgi:release factor glutamine methyltransferase
MIPATERSKFSALSAELEARLSTLPDKPAETALSTLAALWHLATGRQLSTDAALAEPLPVLDEAAERRLAALIERRISGEPLAYITGVQRFMGLDLFASGDALIPRVETEALVTGALEVLAEMRADGPLVVVDVCTGSGNVALAIASHEARARVFASDLSESAVMLARRNAGHLGLADRVDVRCGDLFSPFESEEFIGKVDLVVANPPYISSARVGQLPREISSFEPRLAFDGGPLGVQILQRLMRESPRFVRPGGWFGFELGRGQGLSVVKRLRAQQGVRELREISDPAGDVRAVLVSR